jgi:hypothetical protein
MKQYYKMSKAGTKMTEIKNQMVKVIDQAPGNTLRRKKTVVSGEKPGGPVKSGEKPGGPVKSEEKPGGQVKSEEKPGGPVKSREKPGGPVKSGEKPGGPVKSGEKPGGPVKIFTRENSQNRRVGAKKMKAKKVTVGPGSGRLFGGIMNSNKDKDGGSAGYKKVESSTPGENTQLENIEESKSLIINITNSQKLKTPIEVPGRAMSIKTSKFASEAL